MPEAASFTSWMWLFVFGGLLGENRLGTDEASISSQVKSPSRICRFDWELALQICRPPGGPLSWRGSGVSERFGRRLQTFDVDRGKSLQDAGGTRNLAGCRATRARLCRAPGWRVELMVIGECSDILGLALGQIVRDASGLWMSVAQGCITRDLRRQSQLSDGVRQQPASRRGPAETKPGYAITREPCHSALGLSQL